MTTHGLIVVGAGGHGRVVADAAGASGIQVVAFADDAHTGGEIFGVPVIPGNVAAIRDASARYGAEVVVAIGDNAARKQLQLALRADGVTLAGVIHPSARVLGRARLGEGAVVLAGAVVGVDAEVGDGVIINTGATLDHDCVIGAYAHLSPGVHTGGQVRIGEGTHLAVGVCVRNLMSVGSWSIVGVGAVVVSDIGSRVMAYGVPAIVVRSLEE